MIVGPYEDKGIFSVSALKPMKVRLSALLSTGSLLVGELTIDSHR